MSSVTVRNFSILNAEGVTVTAAVTTARIEIDASDEDIMLINDTATNIFVRTGDASVVADLNAMPILPGEKGVYSKGKTAGTTRFLAYIVVAGTADLIVIQGLGA